MGWKGSKKCYLEITIYLTLGALLSLGGLVALNTFINAESFDFPSMSKALAESGLFESTKSKILDYYFSGLEFWLPFFPFILGQQRL